MLDQLNEFVTYADFLSEQHYKEQNYTFEPPPTHSIEIHEKWAKVYVMRNGKRSSIYAFIACSDFETKQLGKVYTGDIFKPATYKAPAKHARGNLFKPNWKECVNYFGPLYLK